MSRAPWTTGKFHPKFGRLTEAKLEAEIGRDGVEGVYKAVQGIGGEQQRRAIPISGTPFMVGGNTIFPRMQGGGFASLSDLIAEASGGKRQDIRFHQIGTAGVVARSNSLWDVGPLPAAGGVGGAAPGGTVPDETTQGGLKQTDPAGGDTLHFVSAWVQANFANTLLLTDKLMFGTQSLNATNTAWTGVPTRYTSTADASGNFFTCELTTVMNGTATNLTVTYVDQAGNIAEAAPAVALTVSTPDNSLPLLTNGILPLNTGDVGLRNFTNVASSGANTGVANMCVHHAIAVMPVPVVNVWTGQDGINSAFNLAEVKTNACLSFLEMTKPATNATTYSGHVLFVSG